MKILSLNTWHGECIDDLRNFLRSELDTTDVFCFQETNGKNIESILAELFDNSQFIFAHTAKVTDTDRHYSLHTLVKKPFEVYRSEDLFDDSDAETGQALATTIRLDTGHFIEIVNVHGVPFKIDNKLDTEGRLRQTDTIITWLQDKNHPAVVCGDFNLLPEAKSITNFEAAGFRNLIKEYKIPTTRNKLAWERFPDNKQLFADYTFASQGLKATSFSVPNVEVSDHLPMIIELAE